jgi:hypothetical protein
VGRQLSDWLTSWMEYTKESEPKDSYKLWTAISMIAAALRRKCAIDFGGFIVYPNMYIVLVGPSGARKGTAMGPGLTMLRNMGTRLAAESVTREQLIRSLKNSTDSQVLGDRMVMHASLTIYSPELTVFLGYNNQQLMSDLCDWYDCGPTWKYETKHQGVDDISGVWVNLLGATTPSLLQTTLPRDAIGGGLTARMILIFERTKGRTVIWPCFPKDLGDKLQHDLEHIAMMHGDFKVTDKWIEIYSQWRHAQDQHPPDLDNRFGGYVERRAIHILKLCMIMSASRSQDMNIDEEDIVRAINLLEDVESRMALAFSGVGRSKVSDILTSVWQYIGMYKEVSMSTLMRQFYYDVDKDEMNKILRTLESMNVISVGHKGLEEIIKYKKGD